jgi:flavin reductase (DIM6/NTAB) family NADH-FMN oxidoreductase RutF
MIMERIPVPYHHRLDTTLTLLASPGLLLAATKRSGQSNVMTIGWASVGWIWGKPVFVTMVRPSRYTYSFMEEARTFTVNVPTLEMREWVTFCGTRSGREVDKFAAYKMSVSKAQHIEGITIDACPLVYECRVVHVNEIVPAALTPEIESRAYRGADYHRFYYGEILGTYAAPGY